MKCSVLTPASAMGLSLVHGLERAGVTFEVVDDVPMAQAGEAEAEKKEE